MSLSELLEPLARLDDRVDEDRRAKGSIFFGVAGLLRQDAKARREAARRVRQGDRHAVFLLAALGDAGTQDTQATMVALAERGLPEELDLVLVRNLTLTATPTEATLEFLLGRAAKEKNHEQVFYSLGTASHHLQRVGGAEALANRAAARLLDALRRATRTEDRVVALRALGNAGYAPAALDLLEWTESRHPESVRAAAVDGLRRIAGAEFDRRLHELAVGDASERVRTEAVRAIAERPPSPEAALALDRVARIDATTRNRAAAVAIVLRPEWPLAAVHETLAWAKDQPFASGLRQAIESRLAGRA